MENSTLKQIAAELGVSISTVSRAINGKSVVKEETRRRVLEMVEKYSYSPNAVAQALQKSSTKTIAVVLPDISETFFGTIVKAIDEVVSRHGYILLVADTHEKAHKEHRLLQMLYTRRVDALVLATVLIDGSSVERFENSGTPVVFIDNIPAVNNADAIAIDNRKASRLAVEHLVANGHKRIATIIGSKEETTGFDRLAGYREALSERGGVDERLIAYGDYKRESGYAAMKVLLENRDTAPFTAVYITSEGMTYGAMRAIHESGLRVPQDISVVGFDIHPSEDTRYQTITSVRQPEQDIGRMVGERLLVRLGVTEEQESKAVPPEPYLMTGDTVLAI